MAVRTAPGKRDSSACAEARSPPLGR
jgi:hypothetical protein